MLRWGPTPRRRNHFDFIADTPRDIKKPGRYRIKKVMGHQLELLFNGVMITYVSAADNVGVEFLKNEAKSHMERLNA